MIDWKLTKEKFNITSIEDSGYRPKVICRCDDCGKTKAITIRVKSRIQDNQLNWKCQKCIGNIEENKQKLSKSTKKSWRSPKYAQAQRNKSQKLWKDPKYRDKVSKSLKKYYDNDKIKEELSIKYKKKYNSSEYKKSQRLRSQKLWENNEFKEKMAEARSNVSPISKPEKIFKSILNDLCIEHKQQFRVGFYTFDFMIPRENKPNLLIEIQGDYWHSLPNIRHKDKRKESYITNNFTHNYELKQIWEHELCTKDRIIWLLKYWTDISIITKDFNFNSVSIKKTNKDDAKKFLYRYHYIGKLGNNSSPYGAYIDDKLIAICSFSSITRKESAERLGLESRELRELSRLCIHPQYQKKNFASWLISRCIKLIKNEYPHLKCLISFADTTFNHNGTIYKASNWVYDGKTAPSYWYVDRDGYVMHKKTLYNRALSAKMKEKEFADKFGYTKVHGKEKCRFIYKLY